MNKVIRNIPDDVAKALKAEAKASGLTLEAYLRLKLIEMVRGAQQERQVQEKPAEQKSPASHQGRVAASQEAER